MASDAGSNFGGQDDGGDGGTPPRSPSQRGSRRAMFANQGTAGVVSDLIGLSARHSAARMSLGGRKASMGPAIPSAVLGADTKRVDDINMQLRIFEEREAKFDRGIDVATSELIDAAEALDDAAALEPATSPMSPFGHSGLGMKSPSATNKSEQMVTVMQEKMREQQQATRQRLLVAQQTLHQNAARLKNLEAVQQSKDRQLALVLSREQVTTNKMRRRIEELQIGMDKERELRDRRSYEVQDLTRKMAKNAAEFGLQMRQFQFKFFKDLQDQLSRKDQSIGELKQWAGLKQQGAAEVTFQAGQEELPPDQDPAILQLKLDKMERAAERGKQQLEEMQVQDRVKTAQLRSMEERVVEMTEKMRCMISAEELMPLKPLADTVKRQLFDLREFVDDQSIALLAPLVQQCVSGVKARAAALEQRLADMELQITRAKNEAEKANRQYNFAMKMFSNVCPAFHLQLQGNSLPSHDPQNSQEPIIRFDTSQIESEADQKLHGMIRALDREVAGVQEIVSRLMILKEKYRELEKQAKEALKEAKEAKAKHQALEAKVAQLQGEAAKEREKVRQAEAKLKDAKAAFEKKLAAEQDKRDKVEKELAAKVEQIGKLEQSIEQAKEDTKRLVAEAAAAARNIDTLTLTDMLRDQVAGLKDKEQTMQVQLRLRAILKNMGFDTTQAAPEKPKAPPEVDHYRELYDKLLKDLNDRGILRGKEWIPGLVIMTQEQMSNMDVVDRMELKEKYRKKRWQAKLGKLQMQSKGFLESQLRVVMVEEAAKLRVGDGSASPMARELRDRRELLEAALEAVKAAAAEEAAEQPRSPWVAHGMPNGTPPKAETLYGCPRVGASDDVRADVQAFSQGQMTMVCGPLESRDPSLGVGAIRSRLRAAVGVKRSGHKPQFAQTLPARFPSDDSDSGSGAPSSPTASSPTASMTLSSSRRDRPRSGSAPAQLLLPRPLQQQPAQPDQLRGLPEVDVQVPAPQVLLAERMTHLQPAAEAAGSSDECSSAQGEPQPGKALEWAAEVPRNVLQTRGVELCLEADSVDKPLVLPESPLPRCAKRRRRRKQVPPDGFTLPIYRPRRRGPRWGSSAASPRRRTDSATPLDARLESGKQEAAAAQPPKTGKQPPGVAPPDGSKGPLPAVGRSAVEQLGGAAAARRVAAGESPTEEAVCDGSPPSSPEQAADKRYAGRFPPLVEAAQQPLMEDLSAFAKLGMSGAFAERARRERCAAQRRIGELVPRTYNTRRQLNCGPLLPAATRSPVCFTLTAARGESLA
eukprot:TRINITY_DN1601_c0_g5_i1.p1 TRINITY_DN1601_c0_g5~~TRINITY_DN1601_c0_g5_i1.p1  ORF type:complete len:1267 (+),score=421.36 TRINITY_DN1601_c0_g5_i1:178-3978(+)